MIFCVLLLFDAIWHVKFRFFGNDKKFHKCPYYMHMYVIWTQGALFAE